MFGRSMHPHGFGVPPSGFPRGSDPLPQPGFGMHEAGGREPWGAAQMMANSSLLTEHAEMMQRGPGGQPRNHGSASGAYRGPPGGRERSPGRHSDAKRGRRNR